MKRYLWLIIPWALFIIAAGAWVAYWNVVANTAETRLAAWAEEERADGAQISFGAVRRHGFPVLMRLELPQLSYAPARGGWRAETERADLHIDLLNPRHVILSAEAPLTIRREGGETSVLTADALIASLETRDGDLVSAGVEGNAISLDDPAKEGVLRVERLVANVRPDPRAEGEYQVAFDATNLALPRPVRSFEQFGLDVGALRAAIVVTHGADLFETAPGAPLGPWREAGGRLRFEALALNWGPLETNGRGEGGLDAERRLSGRLELPIDEPSPLFRALSQNPDADANARQALTLLAAGYALSGDGLTLDVEAENGVLRLEGLSVRTLPPVY